MKQGTPPPPPPPPSPPTSPPTSTTTRGNEGNMAQSTTPSRLRASPKANPTNKYSPKSTPEAKTDRASSVRAAPKSAPAPVRRHHVVNKPKAGEEAVVSRTRNSRPAVEQFARPRQRRPSDPSCRRNEKEDDPDGKSKASLQSETLIQNLQSEVLALKAELDKAQSLNVELQSQNKKLSHDLAAAEAKIAAFTNRDHQKEQYQNPNFREIQKLIASKLEFSTVKKEPMHEARATQTMPQLAIRPIPKAVNVERKTPTCSYAPPPPPPPPPPPSAPPLPRSTARAATTPKAPAVVESYGSLTRQEGSRGSSGSGNHSKPAAFSVHTSIVGEIQNRSAHLLAIKVDIETKGEFINSLIQKVLAAAYTDIEDVLKFVDWLDAELSTLADERAVLKHFKWPERKADAMREAAIEYRELKLLESEISSYQDDTDIPCGAALRKMAGLLDKSERSIQRLIKLRNSVMRSYQDYKIPTDWMLDSGIASKIKLASMNLAKMYIKRVSLEHDSIRNIDRESSQESLLLQGVKFAYRAHEFAGGLDPETLCAFEEIRQQVPGHFGGSRALLAGVKSS